MGAATSAAAAAANKDLTDEKLDTLVKRPAPPETNLPALEIAVRVFLLVGLEPPGH